MIELISENEISSAIRAELRAWLSKENYRKKSVKSLDHFAKIGRNWQKKLSLAGWLGMSWPKEYGGRGLTLVEDAIVQEELTAFQSPQILGLFGISMVGPVLIRHGNSQQKHRFLSKILSGDEIWCQGFSEPSAGSDLAAIRTTAKECSGGFKINGQKVWTSFAHLADYCFVLCRSQAGSERHHGLSYLLVDMKSSGITVRPLKQASGDAEFNELFFDDVFVPADMLVANPGDGWKIAITTLMYERVILTFSRQIQSEKLLRSLLKESHILREPRLSFELARLIVRASGCRALAYKHLESYRGHKDPGPEGSIDKLLWSEMFQDLARFALKYNINRKLDDESLHQYLYSRGRTIAAGTSEIQRNIIAERILGMPRA